MEFYKENTFFSIEQHTGNALANSEHFHNLYEFYYLCEGRATYLINDKLYNIEKDDIVIIPPNTLHKTIFTDDGERNRILFYLDKRFISSVHGAHLILPDEPTFFHIENKLRIKSIFEELLTEFNTIKSDIYLEALVCELLVILQRNTQSYVPSYEKDDLPIIVSDALTYIASNYSRSLTLAEISKLFYVNSSYLSRLFKEHTGFTFCNYLNQYRIKEANKLLSGTKKQITDIAFECGFNSSNNFCKCYKKVMGISPLTYRKHIKLNNFVLKKV